MNLHNNLMNKSRLRTQLIQKWLKSGPKFLKNLQRDRMCHANVFVQTDDLLPRVLERLDDVDFHKYANLKNISHLENAIKNILIPRVVGSAGHKNVRDFIVNSLRDMGWWVELDKFKETVPIFGELEFQNIIATLTKAADKYLILSCHYDSKYFKEFTFLGATDSAVPCAMLLNLAKVLQNHLDKFRSSVPVSLMLVFFDGEEAFENWSSTDSLYGSRHLADRWQNQDFLKKIDLLVLLDLLGAPDPLFYNSFPNTELWYWHLVKIEQRLLNENYITQHSYDGLSQVTSEGYFQQESTRNVFIDDDHVPFLERNVPVLHIIPQPFPNCWHTREDNNSIIDYATTENLNKILRIFTMQYLLRVLHQ